MKRFGSWQTIKSVIKSKTSKYMIYILRIAIILFLMKQNIREKYSGLSWSASNCPAQWYNSECAVNPTDHVWESHGYPIGQNPEEHPQILFFKKKRFTCCLHPLLVRAILPKTKRMPQCLGCL